MNSEQVATLAAGALTLLNFIPPVLCMRSFSRLGKCTEHKGLIYTFPFLQWMVPPAILVITGVNHGLGVGLVLLAINLGVQIAFYDRMIVKARPKHTWKGCSCEKCGIIDPTKHQIDPKTCKCPTCKNEFHDLDGCRCKRCGAVRHEMTPADKCRCKRCKAESHYFFQGRCVNCGKVQDHPHEWVLFHGIQNHGRPGQNVYKCSVCGATETGFGLGYDSISEN